MRKGVDRQDGEGQEEASSGDVVRVLVANRSDPASVNLRDWLLASGTWEETPRTFRGHPVHSRSEAILVEIDGPAVTDEALDADLRATNLPVMDVWFLSRHAAKSGTPSLTVHPIGNPGEARFGGRPQTLVPAAARDMGALLRRLRHHATRLKLPHQVTYEATHHGPFLSFPTLFLEIGSDDAWYKDPVSGEAAAAAALDVLAGEGFVQAPVLVGLGGGHYAPRATDLALAGEADFGHLLPSHALEARPGPDLLAAAVAATPGCVGLHLHHKGMPGALRANVQAWTKELGVPIANS
jgi:D-aminoacyl-tRNA deacylase